MPAPHHQPTHTHATLSSRLQRTNSLPDDEDESMRPASAFTFEEDEEKEACLSEDMPTLLPIGVESAEDDAASVGADLLSPCTLGLVEPCAQAAIASHSGEMGLTSGVGHVLPSIHGVGDVKRISGATMSRLLRGEFAFQGDGGLDEFVIIDCRYDYEYAGGHIQGAINIDDRALLSKFFRTRSKQGNCSRLAVIFHCEFSQNRAPKSYKFFRSLDRLRNQANYPHLSFPELCVLDGGYKLFHTQFPQHCQRITPLVPLQSISDSQTNIMNGAFASAAAADVASNNCSNGTVGPYVSMWDEAYTVECKLRTAAHRKSWNNGTKLLSAELLKSPVASPGHGQASSSGVSGPTSGQSRGQKRAACGSPGDTPSRTASMPGCRMGLFAPIGGALFASPQRAETKLGGNLDAFFGSAAQVVPMSGSSTTTPPNGQSSHMAASSATSGSQPMNLSPLPSFSLMSAQVTPNTPNNKQLPLQDISPGQDLMQIDSQYESVIRPVPFHCFSPEKSHQ